MAKYHSSSEAETKLIAGNLAKTTKGRIFALTGELGAGKTIFAQGFAKGLGITEKIISPTFVLIRQHKIPDTGKTFYHLDLYRLDDTTNFKELGLEEIWSDPNNIVLIEWAEKIKKLPKGTVKISIQKEGTNGRNIIIHNS
ncbi:tRNA (adenosine(37)-N6)-threonylcarbamoyltransferase complex ATPase subunit type 1 TsaE [Candidatus Daviesbacteria bacterium RIFCSPLOWO2_02_FULL_41_8]|uniref:tRNA threonylcarbamoyladenosine biosynthesis protein TsaE n=2 Tax=Candidatus Daviesiibacteriota TaxID=1752718 RepID=A0A1F5NIY4_9BACT|nr:MAG: tRNA (adenosine(37)-N6)-threonylcarbamoyltransferase complex ATPase subunit type 1 TsaE [Candidatus Daviesbacteria bacterium RIFCSPHIGHO2_02_FULL_41_10]OGE77595.1 MAG: tRNA (adenosine(37)-N6)-threonylcarbamoyltransferase complex ATPase subunit type 1 TsaE [Candidatus Daviesbacteria bacterium RIFCSPLOWO2_02_FULL_41_8]